jgi:hypothetical protein
MELARLRHTVIQLADLDARLVVRRVDRVGAIYQTVDSIRDAEGLWIFCPACCDRATHRISIWTWKVPEDVSPGPVRYHLIGNSTADVSVVAAGTGETDLISSKTCGLRFVVRLGAIHLLDRPR